MTKPPFRVWRIWHQAKLAKRRNDVKATHKLVVQYAKLIRAKLNLT